MKKLAMPISILLVYLFLLAAPPTFASSSLPFCNEMENIQMKCSGKNGKRYGSRIQYCKKFPRDLGCDFINKTYSN